jgi:hypothetical protein
MSLRADLEQWTLDALNRLGGSGKIVPIAREIWESHQTDIAKYPNGMFTWQYDMRWAGQSLAKKGRLSQTKGVWSLR